MKKYPFYIVFILFLTNCSLKKGLISDSDLKRLNYQEVKGYDILPKGAVKPDIYPKYPNGLRGLTTYIGKTLTYPPNAYKNKVKGQVIVSYVIKEDGSVGQVKVIKKVHPELDAEAVRVIKSMSNWYPGKKNGKFISVEFKQPFDFTF